MNTNNKEESLKEWINERGSAKGFPLAWTKATAAKCDLTDGVYLTVVPQNNGFGYVTLTIKDHVIVDSQISEVMPKDHALHKAHRQITLGVAKL